MGCKRDSRITSHEKASMLCPLLEPAIEVKTDVVTPKKKEFVNQTPAEWCDKFGIEILDPDGWDRRDPRCMEYAISCDDFINRYYDSTSRIVDMTKYQNYRHLFC